MNPVDEEIARPAINLYMDESGELGQKPGSSKFFLITILSTSHPKALRKRVKREKAKLYNAGWPKGVEIKGTTLWGADHIPQIPQAVAGKRLDSLRSIINSIVSGPVKVHYSIARKDRLTPHLRSAPYGVVFNFLACTLLVRAYPNFLRGPLDLTVDQRSKETGIKMKFDGYVETRLVTDCNHQDGLEISHKESHDNPGLQAADFMSWGLFRHFEHGDDQFAKLIVPAVGYVDAWYPGKWCPGIQNARRSGR